MLRLTAFMKSIPFIVVMGAASPASASLIGDTVTFQCTNCGPPTFDTFAVQAGVPELRQFDQVEIDVEASTLRIRFLFDADSLIPNVNIIWSDLDWIGDNRYLAGVFIDPTSTWGRDPAVTLISGKDFVSVTNNNDATVRIGDYLLLNLEFESVPEPGSLALLALPLGAISLRATCNRIRGRRGRCAAPTSSPL